MALLASEATLPPSRNAVGLLLPIAHSFIPTSQMRPCVPRCTKSRRSVSSIRGKSMSTGQACLQLPHRLLANGSGEAFSMPLSNGVTTAPIGPG